MLLKDKAWYATVIVISFEKIMEIGKKINNNLQSYCAKKLSTGINNGIVHIRIIWTMY